MTRLKLDPSAVIALMQEANSADIPHWWVQALNRCQTTLSWERDGTEFGLRITLHPNGTWSAEMDFPS